MQLTNIVCTLVSNNSPLKLLSDQQILSNQLFYYCNYLLYKINYYLGIYLRK